MKPSSPLVKILVIAVCIVVGASSIGLAVHAAFAKGPSLKQQAIADLGKQQQAMDDNQGAYDKYIAAQAKAEQDKKCINDGDCPLTKE